MKNSVRNNMRHRFLFILLCASFSIPTYAEMTNDRFTVENLVYTVRGFPSDITQGTIAIDDLKKHALDINILASQAYSIDDKGLVLGTMNPQMVKIANRSHIQLMPLVTNSKFDPTIAHAFLADKSAQKRAIASLLILCKEQKLYGMQIDFEGISFLDKTAFTQFYQKVAQAFHANGLKIAIAVVPVLTEQSHASDYLRGRHEKWTGVYDYKALGDSSDFVTLMAYDHHGGITPPGPMAGIIWDEAIIKQALRYIPAKKISLGTPWRAGLWYTGRDTNSTHPHRLGSIAMDLTYQDAMRLLDDHHVKLQWNHEDKVHFAIYRNHFLYEYMYLEDVDSFREKLALVKKYNLRGVSNWCLGGEDPRIWDVLKPLVNRK